MKNTYNFDWSNFTDKDLERCNSERNKESEIYGYVFIQMGDRFYIVDIRHEYCNSKDCGFNLEIFMSNKMHLHFEWVGSIRDIKSAKNYRNFRHRAENLIIGHFVLNSTKGKAHMNDNINKDDVIETVKALKDAVEDDCTWSGVLLMAAELLGVSIDTVNDIVYK